MTSSAQSWSLVIFCYNEQGTIARIIEDCLEVGRQLNPLSFEVLVVDDGCTDGSSPIIDEYVAKHPEVVLARHEKNKGIGYALTTGYRKARYENICAVPADGQFDVKELIPHKLMAADEIVAFYRPVKSGYSTYRNILSWFNFTMNKVLLGLELQDVNWVKVYKKQYLDDIPLDLKSSLIESELCAKLKSTGVVFKEYPSAYLTRESGVSKGGSLKTLSAAAFEFLKLIVAVNKFRAKRPAKAMSISKKI